MLTKEELEQIGSLFIPFQKQLNRIEKDIAVMKEDISGLKEDVHELQAEMAEVKQDIFVMKQDIAVMKEDISGLKEDVSDLQVEMTGVKAEMRDIKISLENETNHNIRIIAEGHTDLVRKLDDSLKITHERELMLVRVTVLENDMRKVKERIGLLA